MNNIRENIGQAIEDTEFYIGNSDGEYSEKQTEKIIQELTEGIEEDKSLNNVKVISDYLCKEYPYNTNKDG